jgi:hypothetical protein
MGFHVLLAMSVPCFLLMAYMAAVVLGLDPLWDAQYTVPMLGMLLVGWGVLRVKPCGLFFLPGMCWACCWWVGVCCQLSPAVTFPCGHVLGMLLVS